MNQPKYIIKWNNGVWKIFNTIAYRDEAIYHIKIDAEKALKG